jgi:uncharacterized protein
MRVIITGGTGMIGRALARELVAGRHEVIALSRDPAQHVGKLPRTVRLERWDGRTADGWGSLVDGAWAIVNLAGENIGAGRWTAERKQRIRDSRIQAIDAVAAAVRAAQRPGVVIQGSAVGYYGVHGAEEIDEDGAPGRDEMARLLQDAEGTAIALAGEGVRVAISRTGVVLSKQGGALPRMMLPFKLFVGGPLGGGRQYLSWVHLDDVVGGLRHLVESDSARGAYNVTSPQPVTNAEFGRVLGRAMGRPSLMPTPGFALKLVFGEMSTVLLDGQRIIPRRLSDAGYIFRFASLAYALEDLMR